ncbi:hypothetical protein [Zobellia nedashkovskayae]|nr:hypothetical protein [Zobellia nedashkovskayae]
MKTSNLFKVIALQKTELISIEGGSVDPDALREYIEHRYPEEAGFGFN